MTLKYKTLFWLNYPALMLLTGILFFYSQMIFGWWHLGSSAASVFSYFTFCVLLLGMVLALKFFKDGLKEVNREMTEMQISQKIIWTSLCVFGAFIFLAFFSGLKPAHRFTEGDFLEYHLYIPKQNWLRGSWRPIDWHVSEFLSLTIDYALSSFWISQPMLNRLPQLIIEFFLMIKIFFSFNFLNLKRPYFSGFCALLCFLGFRGVCTQVGIAMLDLVNLYFGFSIFFFLAALYNKEKTQNSENWSLLFFLFGVDIAAYLGHKSFGAAFFVISVVGLEILLRKFLKVSLLPLLKVRSLALSAISVFIVWVPGILRSFIFTGDPFFPVLSSILPTRCVANSFLIRTCSDNPEVAQSLIEGTQHYGYGHGVMGLVKSFFLLPLNWPVLSRHGFFFGQNRFDYPLGIFWFLAWGLFFFAISQKSFDRRPLKIFGWMLVLLFGLWFALSQQGRWLYPLILTLSLFWGYFISQGDWLLATTQKRVGLLLALSLMCVSLNGTKIIFSQISNIGCMGVDCLHFQADLFSSYHEKCLEADKSIPNGNHLGYYNCPVHTPRSDFPWVKKSGKE